jgi:ABC-type branched-subunit amino acid transport system ATPase component
MSSTLYPWAPRLQLLQRALAVRPRVDQRQRRVLDQVGVYAPDLKRRRNRQAMDVRIRGDRQQLFLAGPLRLVV